MPLQADLDGDGIVTADEMALALKLDHEGDGVIDVDLDLDGDGMLRLCPLIGSDRKSHVSAAHRRPGPRSGRAQWLA